MCELFEGCSRKPLSRAWSLITSTSVGFGDHYPSTDEGKLAVCAYAFATMQAAGNACDVASEFLQGLCTQPRASKAKRG